MPYKKLDDLPKNVKSSLPKQAQEIYMVAFNTAHKTLKCDFMRKEDDVKSCESSSHRAAWSAVKKDYRKDEKSGDWVKLRPAEKTKEKSKK